MRDHIVIFSHFLFAYMQIFSFPVWCFFFFFEESLVLSSKKKYQAVYTIVLFMAYIHIVDISKNLVERILIELENLYWMNLNKGKTVFMFFLWNIFIGSFLICLTERKKNRLYINEYRSDFVSSWLRKKDDSKSKSKVKNAYIYIHELNWSILINMRRWTKEKRITRQDYQSFIE
jgi:hypothetical protein